MDLLRRFAVPIVILFSLSAGGLAIFGLPGDTLVDGEGISGTYVVNGVDPTGVEYSGTVTIGDGGTDDRFYEVQWLVTGSIQAGEGELVGDQLTVDWDTVVNAGDGSSTGTATYTVGDDGVLTGERFIDGIDEPGTETIYPET